mmetsp:Transcript_5487/g.8188  ORF Transcript_5487/g.8188 Transcript_5487/m.8188 type:complete len:1533 (-) Transcript_5487:580-5178(-)
MYGTAESMNTNDGGATIGDIWSTGAFSFESPLKDLLDAGSYTLEDLLGEDELLQELRGMHPQLIEFFSREETVEGLVRHLICPLPTSTTSTNATAVMDNSDDSTDMAEKIGGKEQLEEEEKDGGALGESSTGSDTEEKEDAEKSSEETAPAKSKTPPGEWLYPDYRINEEHQLTTTKEEYELKYIRYPYMACEVICCEINGILNALVEGKVRNSSTLSSSSIDNAGVVVIPNQSSTLKDEEDEALKDFEDELGPVTIISNLINNDGDDEHDDDEENLKTAGTMNESNSDKEQCPSLDKGKEDRTMTLLDLLFSLLQNTPPSQMDDRRAGYFEKIISVLFRRRPQTMSAYINGGSTYKSSPSSRTVGKETSMQRRIRSEKFENKPLMDAFFRHLHSHSIMQIVQRLLLPPLTGSNNSEADEDNENGNQNSNDFMGNNEVDNDIIVEDEDDEDDNQSYLIKCNWSESSYAIELLLSRLEGSSLDTRTHYFNKIDRQEAILNSSQHASEILITMIQNSPLTSSIMLRLTSEPAFNRVVNATCSICQNHENGKEEKEHFSMHESTMTCAMNVLESLVLQLGGYGAVGSGVEEEEMEGEGCNTNIGKQQPNKEYSSPTVEIATSLALIEQLPNLLQNLSYLLTHPSTTKWLNSTQYSRNDELQPQLGTSRLRIVRLLESLVLLGDVGVDEIVAQSNCLELCLDLFWNFEWCSMLHQSVANLLVHVFEGGNDRVELQRYFIVRCNLLQRLIDSFEDGSSGDDSGQCSVEEEGGDETQNDKQEDKTIEEEEEGVVFVGSGGEIDTGSASGPRYSDIMLALKNYRSEQQTSSVESERGSSAGSASTASDGDDNKGESDFKEGEEGVGKMTVDDTAHGCVEGVEGVEDLVVPVTDEDVDVALEQQQEEDEKYAERKVVVETATVSDNDEEEEDNIADQSIGENVVAEGNMQSEDTPAPEEEGSEKMNEKEETQTSTNNTSVEPSFRMGYMGHVIIICQALVHACSANEGDDEEADNGMVGTGVETDAVEDTSSSEIVMNGGAEGMVTTSRPTTASSPICDKVSKKRKDRPSSASDDEEDNDNAKRVTEKEEGECMNQLQSTDLSPQEEKVRPSIPSNQLAILQLIQEHPLRGDWQHFITTTLASETAVQSAPLGGFSHSASDEHNACMQDLRSSLQESGDFLGGNAPAGGITVGGDVIDMDDTDLDIAASMMEALSLPTSATGPSSGIGGGEDGRGAGGAGHYRHNHILGGTNDNYGTMIEMEERGVGSSGAGVGSTGEYFYDDPLGHGRQFEDEDCDDDDGEIDLQDDDMLEEEDNVAAAGGSNDSNLEKNDCDDDDDVPVMDLFAGNFSFESGGVSGSGDEGVVSSTAEDPSWANFANFDDAFAAAAIPEPTPIGPKGNDLFPSPPTSSFEDVAAIDLFAGANASPADDLFGSEPSSENSKDDGADLFQTSPKGSHCLIDTLADADTDKELVTIDNEGKTSNENNGESSTFIAEEHDNAVTEKGIKEDVSPHTNVENGISTSITKKENFIRSSTNTTET